MSRRRRIAIGVVDQGLSSASNVLVVFAIARVSSVREFGAIALVMMFLTTALAIGRGSFGTPLLLTGSDPAQLRRQLAGGLTGSIALGVVVAVCTVVAGHLLRVETAAVGLAFAAPLVLTQDVHRYAALGSGRPGRAAACDGLWAAGSLVLLVATWLGWGTPTQVVLGWVVLVAMSLFGMATQFRVWPAFRGWGRWWAEGGRHRVRFGLEGAIGAVSSLVVVSAAAVFIGESAAGALRGAGTIMGPLSILMTAIPLAVVPEAVRSQATPRQTWRGLRRLAFVMSVIALLLGSVASVLPQRIGVWVLGASWSVVHPILPITGAEYAALAWVSVMYTALRSQGRSTALLAGRCVHSGLSMALALVAAWWWSTAPAVAIALAVTAILVAIAIRPLLRLAKTPA